MIVRVIEHQAFPRNAVALLHALADDLNRVFIEAHKIRRRDHIDCARSVLKGCRLNPDILNDSFRWTMDRLPYPASQIGSVGLMLTFDTPIFQSAACPSAAVRSWNPAS